MATVKKFGMYFLMFVALFFLISFLTNVLMQDNYKDISNYKILTSSPVITVSECKSANTNGYVKGSVTNNTKDIIPLKYLKIDLYDKDEVYLGTEYKELKNFYPKETINFNISYNYNNIDKVTLNITDEMTKNEIYNFFSDLEDNQMEIALPIAGILILYAILP